MPFIFVVTSKSFDMDVGEALVLILFGQSAKHIIGKNPSNLQLTFTNYKISRLCTENLCNLGTLVGGWVKKKKGKSTKIFCKTSLSEVF